MDYISIDNFEGPLDLLLHLVKESNIDIFDIKVEEITEELKRSGIHAEADVRNEKVGFKIREAQLEKVPYMLIIGDKEAENGTVAVRSRKDGDIGAMSFDEFKQKILVEIATKAHD